MMYSDVTKNLDLFMSQVGYASYRQISRFFRMTCPEDVLKRIVDDQIYSLSLVVVDEQEKIYRWKNTPPLSYFKIQRRLKAIDVLSTLRAIQVTDITPMCYPRELAFITPVKDKDNDGILTHRLYDISVIEDDAVAQYDTGIRWSSLPKGAPDLVNHIAVVSSPALGEKLLRNYGFTAYAIIGTDHQVELTYLENE